VSARLGQPRAKLAHLGLGAVEALARLAELGLEPLREHGHPRDHHLDVGDAIAADERAPQNMLT
jgi:hypothetical protein